MKTLLVKQDLSPAYHLSLVIALMMMLASLAGILFQSSLYPDDAMRQSFVANDVVNLVVGLPSLAGSVWFARRGKLAGLLFLPGALLYVIYNYLAYAVAMSQTLLFFPCLFLVALSVYTLARTILGMDTISIKNTLTGFVPERLTSGVLIGFGALFFLRTIGQAAGILVGQISLEGVELGVMLADLLTTPLWVAGGILLWRKHPLGYACGLGLLFQASMLFIGLLVFFILQPFLSALPFRVEDFVVIAAMSLVCLIPFGMFVKGMLSSSR
jgi:hypothetical protein